MPGFRLDPVAARGGQPDQTPPSAMMARPEWFGTFSDPLDPAEGVDPADARYIAGNVQHWISNRVREDIALRRTNLATYLEHLGITAPGMDFHHVTRTLHGDEPMTLVDLAVWANEFDTVREILTTVYAEPLR